MQRTSSTKICDTDARSGSHCSRRRSTPVVQSRSLVFEDILFSNLIEYPHVSPTFSVRSSAIRSETPIALIRLGCVTMIFVAAPSPFNILSSRTIWGTWVVLPETKSVRERPQVQPEANPILTASSTTCNHSDLVRCNGFDDLLCHVESRKSAKQRAR